MRQRFAFAALVAVFGVGALHCTGNDPDFDGPTNGDASSNDDRSDPTNDGGNGGDGGGGDANVDGGPKAEGKPVWSTLLGTTDRSAVAVDANGNVFVAVAFQGIDHYFGDKPLTANGQDIAVLKLTPDGKVVTWAKLIGGAGEEGVSSISVDPGGDVYVAGYFTSLSVDVSGITVTKGTSTARQGFVARLSGANGMGSWASGFTLTAAAGDRAECTQVHATTTAVAFTCAFHGALAYPGGTKSLPDRFGAIVGKMNPANGTVTAAQVIASVTAGAQEQAIIPMSAQVDNDGSVYVTGQTNASQLAVGGVPVANSAKVGNTSGFVMKLPSNLSAPTWNRILGPSSGANGSVVPLRLRVDAARDVVYVVGEFSGNADFGFGNVGGADGGLLAYDVFVVKYDAQNTPKWQKTFGGGSNDAPANVDVDPSGNPIVVATLQQVSSTSIDGHPLPTGEVFLAMKLDESTGASQYVTARAASVSVTAHDVAAVPSTGHAVATGYVSGMIDFDRPLTASPGQLFVVDLSP